MLELCYLSGTNCLAIVKVIRYPATIDPKTVLDFWLTLAIS